ncbi:MAG: diguanylate cyclase [Desulfobacteraceae bacterium]|nr:diguanylate cyclase [Desulfobacteraceae bacterium]
MSAYMSRHEKIKILVVDDREVNISAIKAMLKGIEVEIVEAYSGDDALAHALEYEFALLLIDLAMPEMDGLKTAQIIRDNRKIKNTPIVFVTDIDQDTKHLFKGYELGGIDYIFKPIDPNMLKNKVKIFLDFFHGKKEVEDINLKLHKSIEQIEIVNIKILEQQGKLIEEERLKVLLQMAGATAHELSQPLQILIGNIELMEMLQQDGKDISQYIEKIKESGTRIAEVAKKIQNLKHDQIRTHDSSTKIIDIHQSTNILYVEDSKRDFNRLKKLLTANHKVDLLHVKTIKQAFSVIEEENSNVDIIFLDYILKSGTAFDFMELCMKKGINIPVIIVTGHGSEKIASQLIKAGAYDYFPKSELDANSVIRSINSSIDKARLQKELDIVHKKIAENSIKDGLTGLYNHRYFMEALEIEFERALRYNRKFSLLMVDIDYFKVINDKYGHQAGDGVLSGLSDVFRSCVRKSDVVCRYGGEEFTIILPDTDKENAIITAEKIRKEVEKTELKSGGHQIKVTISVGICTNHEIDSPRALIGESDRALYRAKNNGRNRSESY